MLALVAYSLKSVKHLEPYKRTQHCWPTTRNNSLTCCVRLHGPLLVAYSAKFKIEYLNDKYRTTAKGPTIQLLRGLEVGVGFSKTVIQEGIFFKAFCSQEIVFAI